MSRTSPSPAPAAVGQQELDLPVPRSVRLAEEDEDAYGGAQKSYSSGNPKEVPLSLPSPPMSRIGLNDHKAGMEGLDKDKINQVCLDDKLLISTGSCTRHARLSLYTVTITILHYSVLCKIFLIN